MEPGIPRAVFALQNDAGCEQEWFTEDFRHPLSPIDEIRYAFPGEPAHAVVSTVTDPNDTSALVRREPGRAGRAALLALRGLRGPDAALDALLSMTVMAETADPGLRRGIIGTVQVDGGEVAEVPGFVWEYTGADNTEAPTSVFVAEIYVFPYAVGLARLGEFDAQTVQLKILTDEELVALSHDRS